MLSVLPTHLCGSFMQGVMQHAMCLQQRCSRWIRNLKASSFLYPLISAVTSESHTTCHLILWALWIIRCHMCYTDVVNTKATPSSLIWNHFCLTTSPRGLKESISFSKEVKEAGSKLLRVVIWRLSEAVTRQQQNPCLPQSLLLANTQESLN